MLLCSDVKNGACLSLRERAYVLDSISHSSFYADEFGELNSKDEERLIVSIFNKMQAL